MRIGSILAVFLLYGTGSAAEPAHRLTIVTCTTVLQDILRHVAGDRVTAECLMLPGVDVHAYQPVPDDARRLARADLIIVNGLGFEGWFDALLRESGFHGTVVTASAGVTPLWVDRGPGEREPLPDPHAYNDLSNGIRYAENIRDAVMAADPPGAEDYEAWSGAYIAQLRMLDGWVKRQLARVPPAQRCIVTDHDGLRYFARAYGLSVMSVTNAMEDSQPGALHVSDLIQRMTADHLRGVFLEPGRNPKLIEQIAHEAGVRIGEALYLDGTGPPGSLADSYQGMFLANVRTIVRTLQ